jgi:DNA-binding IscR family transcriptional regulator
MAGTGDSDWGLLSNHGKVLVCVARDPGIRVSDIAATVGIRERAVQRILADLRSDGIISAVREGRRNRYRVNRRRALPVDPLEGHSVGDVVDSLVERKPPSGS